MVTIDERKERRRKERKKEKRMNEKREIYKDGGSKRRNV